MFGFRKKSTNVPVVVNEKDDEKDNENIGTDVATGYTVTESARASANNAAVKFAKPDKYTRKLIDDGAAKKNIKLDAFKNNAMVKAQHTGDTLKLTKAEAKQVYGKNWKKHLAETDHKISLEKRYEQTKKNPWLTNDDIKKSSNSSDNLEIVSRKYNNAKRSRSAKEFVEDEEYLKKTGIKLSEQEKKAIIKSENQAQKALNKKDAIQSAKNIAKTGHTAGMSAGKEAGGMALTMSGIMNITAVMKGEKSAGEAVTDTIKDGGKAAVTGYVMGGGLTTVTHSLSSSSSKFVQALSKSNVPGKIITTVMVTGDTLKKYCNGEITTQECILELGEKGLNLATTSYAMAVGQTLIPIPIVGAAVGALVGSALTSKYYNELITALKTKQLEHEERLRIIEECERAAEESRKFRAELESYLETYFKEYQDCFNEALVDIELAFQTGDADGIISGANQITRKLGGRVNYETVEEFKGFLNNTQTDIL